MIAPYQPFRVLETCLDTPPIFAAHYFHEAATAIANKIDTAVTVNQGGMVVYVTLITHDSFQNNAFQFSVPAFPADPAPPVKAAQGDNPYDNATAQQDYQNAFASWQVALVTQHQKLAGLRSQVKQETDKMRSEGAPYDNTGADVFGCLDTASQHFQGVTGEKFLLIASPLINNTLLQAATISLAGVSVRVIWHTCTIASICQSNDANWKKRFLQFGAKDVQFYDPAQEEASPVTF
jgi:hypothetical protein